MKKTTILVLLLTFAAAATVNAAVSVDPNQFDLQMKQGCTETRTLTITNTGASDLNFIIRSHIVGSLGGTAAFKNKSVAVSNTVFAAHKDNNSNTIGNSPYKQGELLVRFARKTNKKLYSRKERDQLLSSLGAGAIKHEFKIVPGLSVVKLPPGLSVENALQKLKNKTEILYAHPNYEVKALSTFPDDPRFNELWAMHNTGQNGGTPDADIDAPEAWDIGTGSTDIVVAVIDTGVDYTHPDLAANMWVNPGEIPANGIDDDGNGYIDDVHGYDFVNNDGDPMDDHYHGTHCAGTIGAVGNNSQGVAGVNWHVKIMAVKFLDAGGGQTIE